MAVAYSWVGVTTYLVVAVLISSVLAATPTLEITPQKAKIGDTVKFSCSLTGSTGNEVTLLKHADGKYFTVATNDDVSRKYATLTRWNNKGQIVTTGEKPKVIITLTAAAAEDAGTYVCSVGPKNSSAELNVIVPVTEAYITALDSSGVRKIFQNGDTIKYEAPPTNSPVRVSMDSYTSLRLVTVVNGSTVRPDISVSIGGEVVTATFVQSASESEIVTNYKEFGLSDFSLRLVYSWTKGEIDHYSGKTLTFTAQVPGTAKMSTSVTLDILHNPKVICKDEFYAAVGESAVINCTVNANPFAGVKMHWEWKDGPNDAVLQVDDERGSYSAKFTEISETSRKVDLEIKGIVDKDFRQYKLFAKRGSYESRDNTGLLKMITGAVLAGSQLTAGMTCLLIALLAALYV